MLSVFTVIKCFILFIMLSCQVAELRNGLLSRNLDTKGTKPVLLQRLKEALEAESDTGIKEENAEDGGGKMDMDISDTDDQNEESEIKQTDDVKPPVEKPGEYVIQLYIRVSVVLIYSLSRKEREKLISNLDSTVCGECHLGNQ